MIGIEASATSTSLRPVTDDDLVVLDLWVERPDISRWWGRPQLSKAEIRTALASESAICRMILLDGVPIGYVQAVEARLWAEDLPDDLPPGAWDADILIGEAAQRGRGLGTTALCLLCREVWRLTAATHLYAFSSVANERALRALEKAGFVKIRSWEDPYYGSMWMTARERPKK
jgi:RimJ/RimL family protein N-acetyltransferase